MRPIVAKVALPVPLDKTYDYLIADDQSPVVGGRVQVSFGSQSLVGIVVELTQTSAFIDKLKPLKAVLDQQPLWQEELYQLLQWCSHYYQYPLGETFSNALPTALRKGKAAQFATLLEWQLTEAGKNQLAIGFKKAVKQAKVMFALEHGAVPHHVFIEDDVSSATLKTLQTKGWITALQKPRTVRAWHQQVESSQPKPRLNQEQAIAIATVNSNPNFACYLLEGVTGSGKTEVYLNMIKPILEQGRQALILVPEIGLTPQTINRFRKRFTVPIEVIHSGLNDTERLNAWLSARDNVAGIIIGTRSALFTPFASLGIIIVDEEHDSSYKQQDSLRYHARDVAVMRASKNNIPIVLGSATPALESLHNALTGKYHHLTLTQRAGIATPPATKVLDVKGLYLESGLSAPLIAQMRQHLMAGNQVLLFLNRRGYSPALMCHQCGWIAECSRCDAYYTYHQSSSNVRCHHCGSQRPMIHQCKACGSTHLVTMGVGTEQLENQLMLLFPEYKIVRIDRDSTQRKGSLAAALEAIRKGKYQILIGTQMLAKGHHFPDVTLVGLLDVDSALYSSDFRSTERFAQLFTQVAGRAGRASKSGEVILQTHHPEHPLLQTLLHKNYHAFAQQALAERQANGLPPYTFLTLFRAEANNSHVVENFLRQVRHILEVHPLFEQSNYYQPCVVLGPTPAPLAKKAGKSRWQLLLQTSSRSLMQRLLQSTKPIIELQPSANKVRWSQDIEPQDLS